MVILSVLGSLENVYCSLFYEGSGKVIVGRAARDHDVIDSNEVGG